MVCSLCAVTLISVCGASLYATSAQPVKKSAQKSASSTPSKQAAPMTTPTWHKSSTGLEHMVVTPGTGAEATKGKTVSVHYTGWLSDKGEKGKKFDSSVDRGMPFEFVLGRGYVIQGWEEGVQGMKEGEKRLLRIPAALGYGSRGAGAVIPPNAELIFEVELLKVK